ncbi:MAG: V0D/AC39 family V-type ATPase subunit [Candidatus Bathyarchaeia archaeon]
MSQTTLYASALAKIGAERSKLLSENKIKALAETRSLAELTIQLRDTGYQEQISKIIPPPTSRKLERAFYENLIETYVKIIKNSPKKARNYLALYLLKFEIEHVKMLMKATSARLTPDQKIAKIYSSVEDYLKRNLVMDEATKASTVNQLIHAFKGTEYWSPLNMGLKNYEENASTTGFDVFVDKFFYEKLYDSYDSLPQKEKPYAFFYASIENDGFTLLTLLRGKALDHDPNWLRLVIPQKYFSLHKTIVEALVTADDFESALKIVLESHYGKFFAKAQSPEETIAAAGKAFKKALLQHAKSSAISEIFNIGSALAFMTQKEAEVFNLTALSLNVSSGIKPDDVRNGLLL